MPYAATPETIEVQPGPNANLSSRALLSLSLVIHELATNAAKYGALSVPGGRVRVTRRLEEENSQLRIEWVESGGPPVRPPETTGYGTQLIQYATTYSLGGTVEQNFAVGGLEAVIVIPLRNASRRD